MSSSVAARCAFGAVALSLTAAANAGFVYQSAARETEASVGGVVVQSEATTSFTSWFGSARSTSVAQSILATHGSSLLADEMNFVGAAQVSSGGDANLAARSAATVTFTADAAATVLWIADLWQQASGLGNAATISLAVVDLTASSVAVAFTGPTLGSGAFSVSAGHTYRVSILATVASVGATNATADYNVGFVSQVPAPGAVALLAVAGLAASRRR